MATKGDQYEGVTGNIWDYANRGDETGVQQALQRGVDVNLQNKVGWTAVHAAARGGQAKMIEFLASKGAELELGDNDGRLPVHEAARSGQLGALQALHQLGCSFAVETDGGQTVLQLAKGDAIKQYVKSVLKGEGGSVTQDAHKAQQGRGGGAGGERHVGGAGGRGGGKGGEKAAWKKPTGGGAYSGKAKKEYLKWKRTQKREGETDSEEEEEGMGTASVNQANNRGSGGLRGGEPGEGDGAEEGGVQGVSQGRDAGGGGGGVVREKKERKAPAANANVVVQYVPLERLDGTMTLPNGVEVDARMARGHAADVGFTSEGLKLGMPKRPAWRGVVHSGAELQALEEKAFDKWCKSVAAAAGPGRVSFYEERLEYWRQLWRVLDLCDVALMIVDARNPLLHFSEALAAHVLREHHKPMVLVLNKADLVPQASVNAWKQWFEARHLGMTVVPSSAAPGQTSSAPAIMQAILDCKINCKGARKKVGEVVGKGAEEILAAARLRNTVAKRGAGAAPPATAVGAAGRVAGVGSDFSGGDLGSDGDDDDDDDDGWDLKGNKARKMGAVRKKRAARMHAAVAGAVGGTGAVAVTTGGRKGARGKSGASEGGGPGRAQGRGRGQGSRGASRSGMDTDTVDEDLTERDEDEEEDDQEEEEEGNFNADLEQMERDLLDEEESGEGDLQGEGGDDEDVVIVGGTDQELQQQQAFDRSGVSKGAQKRKHNPIVVCVVGEPNVGKSSTMNALLGTHKVAVSSHPGRTKHYQTHYMTDELMLCDCPGLVFPRLDVPLSMQVLYGSYPIARCRDPYAVIDYLAAHMWPRLHMVLGLRKVDELGQLVILPGGRSTQEMGTSGEGGPDEPWTPMELCEAYAARKQWRSRKGGRLDVYRGANFILRAGLAGKHGVCLAFLPPAEDDALPEVTLT